MLTETFMDGRRAAEAQLLRDVALLIINRAVQRMEDRGLLRLHLRNMCRNPHDRPLNHGMLP